MGTAYLALLRGINVGGNNPVPMADLRACVEDIGGKEVATYIQSGNVLFDGGRIGAETWTTRLEGALTDRFGYTATVVVVSHADLESVVKGAPKGFGSDPERYRSDVLFLMPPLTAGEVLELLTPREGVDTAAGGPGVVYFERITALATKSRLSKVVSMPFYPRITIRNWRTTTTLLRMLDERAA
jgi:uncharacterized protein (DUF1697 family)